MATESPAEKADREAAEAQTKVDAAVKEAQDAAEAAHKAELERIDAEHQAELVAAREASGGEVPTGKRSSAKTSLYELAADTMAVPIDGDLSNGYTSYVKGDKVPLTAGRAAELIAAGAIVDPDAKSPEKPGGETVAPGGKS